MLDALTRHAAPAGSALPQRNGSVTVTATDFLTRFSFRGSANAARAAGRGFGVTLPTQPMTAQSNSDRHALWLGPDEWLLLAPDSTGKAITAAIRTELATEPASLVDVSHRQAGLLVSGARAADFLATACPLDLETMTPGHCTRTVFGKSEIVLWHNAPDTFHVEVWRSFWPFVTGLMTQAARDLF